jgi:hypothetical protein
VTPSGNVGRESHAGATIAPWPGPGNSEAPSEYDWAPDDVAFLTDLRVDLDKTDPPYVTTNPWPGPGDSEGPG